MMCLRPRISEYLGGGLCLDLGTLSADMASVMSETLNSLLVDMNATNTLLKRVVSFVVIIYFLILSLHNQTHPNAINVAV